LILDQITEKSIRPRMEMILHMVLKFQFDHVRFQRGEAKTYVCIRNNMMTASLMQTH